MSHKLTQQSFYHGQNVLPNNLNRIQDLASEGLEHLVSNLLGHGIVSGFDVTFDKIAKKIVVCEGLAFYTKGEMLQLSETNETRNIDVSQYLLEADEHVLQLGIKKILLERSPMIDDQNQTVYTAKTPDVECRLFTFEEGLDANFILLADITITVSENAENNEDDPLNISCNINRVFKTFTTTPSMFNTVYPIGYTYVQYPNPTTGRFDDAENPNTLFGHGIWEMCFNNRGLFFRTEGDHASEARNESTGVQDTAIQHHKHDTDIGSHSHSVVTGHNSWSMRHDGGAQHRETQVGRWSESSSSSHLGTKRSTNIVEGANKTTTETRPINMLMRIWKRTN